FPTFHASLLKPFVPNDPVLFPSREHEQPPPITVDGHDEYFVDRVLDRRRRGVGFQYLVRWRGYGPEHDQWLRGADLKDVQALHDYLFENGL
ncbi:hypothetical protein K474DRAFT_1579364, partial [Panus rudis PR-1116 ss-1]